MSNTTVCPLAKKCGGCQLQNLSYPEQLHLKQATAIRLLGRFGHVEEILGMDDPYHYRNKVQAAFGVNRQGQIISGVYQSASHRIVPVSDCLIEDKVADRIIVTIRKLLKSFKIRPYDEDTGRGTLRHVLVRRGWRSGEILVVLVTAHGMLFSTAPLSQYFVLGTSGDKNSVDKHHIFPKHYLEEIGYDNDRDRNQIANFTYLDYATNIDISGAPPAEYVGRYRDKLGEDGYKLACAQNALPENFEQLSYPEFLSQRRLLMAQIVKKAYNELNK